MALCAIKICDVRSIEALQICKDSNVDYIGMHLINLPIRSDLLSMYREIVEKADHLKTVLLTKSVPFDILIPVLIEIPFDYIQIHRPCSIDEVVSIKNTIYSKTGREIGVISVFEARNCDYSLVVEMSQYADFILFDSHYRGGTGLRITQADLQAIANNCSGIKYFIAGGLTPDNVDDVLRIAHPYGVDVQTGVEVNGLKHVKDPYKINELVSRVRSF